MPRLSLTCAVAAAALLLLLPRPALAQSSACPSTTDCATCVAAGPNCGFCTAYNQCFPSSQTYCNGGATTQTCPALPTAASVGLAHSEAVSTLAVAALAIGALALLTFSRVEGGKQAPTAGQAADILSCFVAAAFLWIGCVLVFAAPAVPWLVYAGGGSRGSPYSSQFFTAFSFSQCFSNSNDLTAQLCQTVSSVQYVSKFVKQSSYDADTISIITSRINSGVAAGSFSAWKGAHFASRAQ